eukprot:COSAG02_NODE_10117_length_2017_cov_2.911366_2_plen_445_part_01
MAGQTCAAATACIAEGNGHCTIPTDFTSIAPWAFDGLESLTAVTIHSGVTSMGVFAFQRTRLTSVVLPDGMAEVPEKAFYLVITLAEVRFGSGITTIGPRAFAHTALTSLELPDSITSVGSYAFESSQDRSLTSIRIGAGIQTLPDRVFQYNGLTSVTLPSTLTEAGSWTFEGNIHLASVTIEDGLDFIGSGLFYGCTSLTEVVIPGSVRIVGGSAFVNCASLGAVTFSYGLTRIDGSAFSNTALSGLVSLPETVTSLSSSAFPSWVEPCGGASSLNLDQCPDADCFGTWSSCTSVCEVASARSWTEIVAQRGAGAACLAAINCQYGEDDCVSCNAKLSAADWNALGYSIAGNQAARTVPGLGTISCHSTHVAEDPITGSATSPTATCAGDEDFSVTGCVPKGACLTGGVNCPTETHHRKPTFNTHFGSDEASCCDVNACTAKAD